MSCLCLQLQLLGDYHTQQHLKNRDNLLDKAKLQRYHHPMSMLPSHPERDVVAERPSGPSHSPAGLEGMQCSAMRCGAVQCGVGALSPLSPPVVCPGVERAVLWRRRRCAV